VNETLLSRRLAARAEPAPVQESRLVLRLDCRRIAILLWSVTFAIIAIGVGREAYIHGYDLSAKAWNVLGLDSESGLGDWWGTIQFALAAVLLGLNAKAEPDPRWRFHWAALAALFVYFSIDESVALHERLINVLAPFHFTGFLRYSWIIPYGIACVIIGLLYLPFVRALPQGFRFRVILSGLLFLAAAIGVESIEGYCHTYAMRACRVTSIIFEEGGEMIALTIFLVTLFGLLRARQRAVTFKLG
jgi:hypothetical protein